MNESVRQELDYIAHLRSGGAPQRGVQVLADSRGEIQQPQTDKH
jgi:hypothetical protein